MLEAHRDELHNLAEALLKYESLNREEVDLIMAGKPLNKATVSELLDAEKKKTVAVDDNRPDPAKADRADDDNRSPGLMPSPA